MKMRLVFEQIRVGGDRNFGYLLGDREMKQAVLIDPAYSPEVLVQRAEEQGLKTIQIVNTHGHHDHINGNAKAVELTGAPVAAHPDCPSMPDIQIKDEQVLTVGDLSLIFIYTPGHCEDHLVVYEQNHKLLVSGDLLFVGKVGGTSTEEQARIEWNSLQRIIKALPGDATVWPGHDYGVRPSSTMKLELETNPFLLCKDLAAFQNLKANWPSFKKEHGLK